MGLQANFLKSSWLSWEELALPPSGAGIWCNGWVSSSHFGSWGDPEDERSSLVFAELGNTRADHDCRNIFLQEREVSVCFLDFWWESEISLVSGRVLYFHSPSNLWKIAWGRGPYKKEKNKKKNLSACIWVDFLMLDARKAFLGRLRPFLTVSFEIAHYVLKEPEPAANYPMEITHCVGCLLSLCA